MTSAMRLRGVARVLAFAAWCAIVGPPALAHADQAGPPPPVATVKGKVDAARLIELDPETKFILVSVAELADASSPVSVPGTKAVPFGKGCERAWAKITSSEADVAKVVGTSVEGIVIPDAEAGKKSRSRFCSIVTGHERLVPEGKRFEKFIDWRAVAKARKDSLLPVLAEMRDFFGASRDGYEESPVESDIHSALSELDSEASFAFALERRMYFFADHNHFRWRRTPSNFTLVSRDLLERPWSKIGNDPPPGRVPDGSLTHLFWMSSPSRAVTSLRALYDAQPEKAMTILRSSPPRDDVLDLLLELTQRDRERWLSSTLSSLAMDGNERTFTFMRRELPERGDEARLAKRLAAIEHRSVLGVTDGPSLARYLWAHRDDPYSQDRPFHDMRVELVGPSSGCCSIEQDLGDGVSLEGKVDCDAESFVDMCKVPRGTIISAVGVISGHYVGTSDSNRYVQLNIDSASVRVGGTVARPPDPGADPTAGAPSNLSKTGGGCACGVVGSESVTSRRTPTLLFLVALAFGLVRGARPSRRSR